MTSPLDSYRSSMDRFRFSNQAQERLIERLQRCRHNELSQGSDVVEFSTHPDITAQSTVQRRSSVRPFASLSLWRVRAAALFVVAIVLGGSATIAVASGVLPYPADVLSDVFGDAPAKTELLNKVGRPLGASTTSNGVTVSAEAVVGDRSNYVIVYTIRFHDSSVLNELELGSDGVLPLVTDASSRVDGADAAGGTGWFFDADPADDTIQYAESMGITSNDAESIIGHTMRFSMSKIQQPTKVQGEFVTLASGSWNLKFTINYVDTTKDLVAGQHTTWQGNDVMIHAIAVSSIGINVDYAINRQEDSSESSGLQGQAEQERLDAVSGLPIHVTLTDGTTIDATNANTTMSEQADGRSVVSKKAVFNRIVSVDDIESVTVGEVKILVNNA